MYFKKLEIFGFKSFADKTVLNFEEGITAVVGPNGCGKSNIFDSIRWVLGEQSIKELRGSTKEDVIFNGTEKKPSLGFAEVSLTFSNENRNFPMETEDVTITRRLFRSGESEYLLNKKTARLKDIQEMLMGTGIGAQAYSMVQQGRVDMVVNSKPEDRRAILDEASGITKYKAKKKEALNKLKLTEDNLVRLNDITTEVKRQIGSIERQATKARKYKAEYEKLKHHEYYYAKYQIENFSTRKVKILSELQALKEKQAALIQEAEEMGGQLSDKINYLSDVEQKLNELNSQDIKLDGQIDINNRQIEFNQERIETIRQNTERVTEKKAQLIERCRIQQEKVEEYKKELSVIAETMQLNETKLREKREYLHGLEKAILDAKRTITDHEEKILNLTSNQVSVRNEVTDVMKETQGAIARKRRLEIENEKVLSEKQHIDQKLQNIDFQIQSLRGTVNDLTIERDIKSQIVSELSARMKQLETDIIEVDKKKLFLKSQKEFIEKMHTQYQDMPDPVVEGLLITQAPPSEHHTGIIGKVKEVRGPDAERLYEIVCETKFIELDPQQISSQIEEMTIRINQLTEEKDGVLRQLNEQQTICQQLEIDIRERERSLSVFEAQRQDILEEIQKLSGEIELVSLEIVEVNSSMEDLKKRDDELNYKLDTITQELNWCQRDIKEKQGWISEKSQEREQAAVFVVQLETEMESSREKLIHQEENFRMFTETLDGMLEEIKKIDDEVEAQAGKGDVYAKEIEELTLKILNIKETKESIKNTLNEQIELKEDLGQQINSMRTNINAMEDEAEQILKTVHDMQMGQQEIGFNEQGIKDRLMQAYKIDYDQYAQLLKEAREAHALQTRQATELLADVVAQGGAEAVSANEQESLVDSVSTEASVETEPSLPETSVVDISQLLEVPSMNEEDLREEVERLRKRCDSFGSVNLVAIEEYEELKERFEFLTKQQSDLFEAKSQLMSTINKINRSTRQMFMDTFTKVSEEFRIYFRMLFGGGEAELVLLDQDNVLESGIDIVARPPGKKLQNISLLSGGEKTLTAIALIFGVFKVNPSPFCVLDEIDAALDESNVGRFSYLLKDFAKVAQFIVITHNKKTIASADVMYGITMPETGCSRIVSVKLADQKKEEAVAAV